MNRNKLSISLAAGSLLGLIFAVGVVFVKFAVHSRLPEGTVVANIDFSMKTKSEAKTELSRAVTEYMEEDTTISFLGEEKTILIKDLGLEIYTQETIDSIDAIDARQVNIFDLFKLTTVNASTFSVKSRINKSKLEQTLKDNFPIEAMAPKNASLDFAADGSIEIQEGSRGLTVNYDFIVDDIMIASSNLETVNLELSTLRSDPEVSKSDLEPQKEDIVQKLGQQIVLVDPVYSDDWYIRLEDHIEWIELSPKKKVKIPLTNEEALIEDEKEIILADSIVHIEIKQDKLDEFIEEEISQWLDREAEDVNITLDENGEVVVEGKGSNGRKVQRKLLKEAMELAVDSGVLEITIPVLDIEPEINIDQELQEMGVRERIAVGHTSFYGSPGNRVHNIKVGAEKFNGKLIAPDEVFSFNTNLGRVDGSTGYRKELVIKPEGTIPEYGGGICQVSTTLYRAVLLSGLPIVERHQHSYAVSYYSQVMGHGLDATIYLGGPDFQFKNDTGEHILMQTFTEGDYELSFVIYGPEEYKKTVEMEGPYLSGYHSPGPTVYEDTNTLPKGVTKQVEKRHTGFTAVWYRHVTDEEGNTETETITTRYKAVPAKIMVGTRE